MQVLYFLSGLAFATATTETIANPTGAWTLLYLVSFICVGIAVGLQHNLH